MPSERPTRVRWTIFLVLLVLCTINYVDRAVISICMPSIQSDLKLDPALVGVILSAFFWGYAVMQIPAGWLADRFPAAKILSISAFFWGVFQILTGILSSGSLLMAVRALLGVAESPMYPASTKMQAIWLTSKERSRGVAVFDSGAAAGIALGGPIVVLFVAWFGGWRGALIGAGLLTLAFSLVAYRFIKGDPDTNPRLNAAERDYLKRALSAEYEGKAARPQGSVGVKAYLGNVNFWLMCIGYYCVGSFWFGIMTWGPNYLAATQHLDIKTIGGAVFLIYGVGVVVEIVGGYFTDLWRQHGGDINTVMRTLLCVQGLGMAAGMYMVTTTSSVAGALTWLTIAVAFERLAGCLYWTIPPAIAQRKDVGIVAGCMNLAGNCAGVITPILIGVVVSATGSYHIVLMLFMGFGVAISVASLLLNYAHKIGSETVSSADAAPAQGV